MSESPITLRGRGGGVVFQGTQSPGGGAVGVATARLNDAQIKALPTTPIILAAAPGPGKQIIPFQAFVTLDTTGGAYTNIDALAEFGIDAEVIVGTPGIGQFLTGLFENNANNGTVSGLFAYGGQAAATFGPLATANTFQGSASGEIDGWAGTAPADDMPLYVTVYNSGAGDLTGGDAANFMRIVALYATVTLP